MKLNRSTLSFIVVTAFIIVSFVVMPLSSALAYSDGPNNPAVGTNVSTIGTEPWLNPEEITTPGSPYSTVTLYHNNIYSQYLQGTQYGFNVPLDTEIVGIEVNINRSSNGNNPSIEDNVVRLLNGGVIVGDNKANLVAWPTTLTMVTYGGPTDLWGADWTPTDINSLDFGVTLAVNNTNNGNQGRIATVDSIQVTVYYSYSSTSDVVCGDGSPVMYGDSVMCVATVTQVGSLLTPTGTVDWSSDGGGTFDPNPCTLVGSDGTSTCSASYTPDTVGGGSHLVTAAYSGDDSAPSMEQMWSWSHNAVTVTADPKTKVYNIQSELTYQVTDGSLVFNDTFTGTLQRSWHVGSYNSANMALSDNYNLPLWVIIEHHLCGCYLQCDSVQCDL
jgi:hypothetical protein